MAGYFGVNQPLEGVYQLMDPRGVNITLLCGKKRAVLIDTGMGVGNAAKAVREITNLPLTVINSHGHADHIAGDYLFPEVYVPAEDWQLAHEELPTSTREHLIGMSKIVPEDFDRAAFLDWQMDNLRPLDRGESMDLGGMTIQMISLPSHTPGSTGFYIKERELLISGDSIAPLVYLVFPQSSSVKKYVEVLESVRDLPFRHILSSHTERLIPKEELELYIACGKAADLSKTTRRKDPLFPQYPGRMFIYEDSSRKGECAILVFTPDKLES